MGMCVFMLWIANAGVAFGLPPVVSALGISPTFFIFAGLGVAALLFIYTMVPETRGRSLEQFEDEFRAGHAGDHQPVARPGGRPRSVMVAVSDSPEGTAALAAAAEADRLAMDLIVVNLALTPVDTSSVPSTLSVKIIDRKGMGDRDPADAVLDEIEDHAVDRLVIGVKPRSPAGKALLGSISQRLLRFPGPGRGGEAGRAGALTEVAGHRDGGQLEEVTSGMGHRRCVSGHSGKAQVGAAAHEITGHVEFSP